MRLVDLNFLLLFEAVARHGGFVAAGRELGLPKATVSRHVAALEAQIGARLLERTTRSVSLTEAGRLVLEHCARIRNEAESAAAVVQSLLAAPRGRLVVAVPALFGSRFLAPALPRYLAAHPEVRVEVRMLEVGESPVEAGVDVSICVGPLPSRRYSARSLGHLTRRLYAAPAYVGRRGTPASPKELARHATLVLREEQNEGRAMWRLSCPPLSHDLMVQATLVSSDPAFVIEAARAGLGIAKLPEALVQDDLANGRLLPVLPDWAGPALELSAVFATRAGLTPKTRSFVDFLARTFRADGPAGLRDPLA